MITHANIHKLSISVAALFLLIPTWGCGLLLGNVKPVAEKSESYRVMDLSKESTDWSKLGNSSPNTSSDGPSSDVAFQSSRTASIVSLNSACRPAFEEEGHDLREFTNLLFLGISDITLRDEKPITLQGSPALETTLRGKLNGEEMMLQTVVLRRATCVYDLMYVSRPDKFKDNANDFAQFVASLRFQ